MSGLEGLQKLARRHLNRDKGTNVSVRELRVCHFLSAVALEMLSFTQTDSFFSTSKAAIVHPLQYRSSGRMDP
jgi:hypothetical protein